MRMQLDADASIEIKTEAHPGNNRKSQSCLPSCANIVSADLVVAIRLTELLVSSYATPAGQCRAVWY
jgi:hypothetical protein